MSTLTRLDLERERRGYRERLKDAIKDANTGGEEAQRVLVIRIAEALLWFLENAKVEE